MLVPTHERVHRKRDGSLDYDFYRRNAHQERHAYLRELVSTAMPVSILRSGAMRRMSLVTASSALSVALFCAAMLTLFPATEASSIEYTGSLQEEASRLDVDQDRCTSGDEVSRFVCRNTWLGQHRYGYR